MVGLYKEQTPGGADGEWVGNTFLPERIAKILVGGEMSFVVQCLRQEYFSLFLFLLLLLLFLVFKLVGGPMLILNPLSFSLQLSLYFLLLTSLYEVLRGTGIELDRDRRLEKGEKSAYLRVEPNNHRL